MSDENSHTNMAFQIAQDMGCPQNNVNDLIKLLKRIPAQNFTQYVYWANNYFRTFHFTYAPVVESEYANQMLDFFLNVNFTGN